MLLAPNNKPSNLTEQQYWLVRTPAFKKWFGDFESYFKSKNIKINNGRLIFEGKDIGVFEVSKHDGYVEIDKLYIDEEYQGQGIGKACVFYVFDNYSVDLIEVYPHPKTENFWIKIGVSNIKTDGVFQMNRDKFSCSKMLDDNGEPVVCYHGTNRDFNVFRSDVGYSNDLGFYGRGYYFTFQKTSSWQKFAKNEALYYGNKLISAFLNIRNPFDISSLSKYKGININSMGDEPIVFLYNIAKTFPNISDKIFLEKKKYNRDKDEYDVTHVPISVLPNLIEDYRSKLKTFTTKDGEKEYIDGYVKSEIVEYDYTSSGGTKGSYLSTEDLALGRGYEIKYNETGEMIYPKPEEVEIGLIIRAIEKYEGIEAKYLPEGYMTRNHIITDSIKEKHDGIIQSESGDEVVVFKSEQIKLADGTNTTFDGNNPDIRFAKGGAFNKYKKDYNGDGSMFRPFDLRVEFPELVYNDFPTEKEIEKLNKWFRDNKEKYVKMYHGTPFENKEKILHKGILPTTYSRRQSYQSESGYVYLSVFPTMSKTFADMANVYSKNNVVFEATIQIMDLKPDTDQLMNKRYHGGNKNIGDTLAESIIYGHGARVRGKVDRNLIRITDESDVAYFKHGGTLYNGIRVPKTVNPRMVISAFENPIDDNKVEEYTNTMKEMMLSHDFPPITGFPTVIDENDVGNYFLSGEEIGEEHIGKQAWKVWDGHHRTLAAINANLPYIEVELEYSAVTDMDEYLKKGGSLINKTDIPDFYIDEKKDKVFVRNVLHGTCKPFEKFEKGKKGSTTSDDIMSNLGFNFTPSFKKSMEQFAGHQKMMDIQDAYAYKKCEEEGLESGTGEFDDCVSEERYNIDLDCRAVLVDLIGKKIYKADESEIVIEVLKLAHKNNLFKIENGDSVDKEKYNQLIKDDFDWQYHPHLVEAVNGFAFKKYNARTDKEESVLDVKKACDLFIEKLKKDGYDIIQYRNEIEVDYRFEYDFIVFDEKQIKYKYKIYDRSDYHGKESYEAIKYNNGGQLLPSVIKYARIKPIREGGEERVVRVSPDEVGGYVAGYVIYYPAKSNNKVAYFNKPEFKNLLDEGSYTLFNTIEQAQSYKPMEIDIEQQLKMRQRMRSLLKLLKYKSTDESGMTKEDKFIERVILMIYDGKDFKSKLDIERIAEDEFGFEDKRKVRELTEYAVLSVGREIAKTYGNDISVAYKKMVSLYSNQPYSTHRTGTSVNLGQFSTPLPMAYLMGCYVGINVPSDKTYFEPTGGNGSLTVAGNVENFVVNELDMHRYNNLLKENYKLVLNQDATKKFDFDYKFDGLLANPPFATTKNDIVVGGFHISGLEQQIMVNSLTYLNDKAKIAFIIGGHTEFDEEGRIRSKKDRAFLSYLFKHYYMDDVINVNGSLYGRQGTTYPIRIILLAAKKSVAEGYYPLRNDGLNKFEPFSVKVIDTFDELFKRTEKYIEKSL